MTKEEWRDKHKLDNNDMDRIEFLIKTFKAKIISVVDVSLLEQKKIFFNKKIK